MDYRALEIEIICDLNKDEISKKIIWYNASVNLGACFCYDVMDPFQRLDGLADANRSVRSALDSCIGRAEKNKGATALPVLHRIGSVPCMPTFWPVPLRGSVASVLVHTIHTILITLYWLMACFAFFRDFFDFSQFLGRPSRILCGFMWRLFWFLSFSKAST